MKPTSGIFFSLKTEQIILTTWCTPSQIIQQYKLVRRRQGIRGRIHTKRKCLICHYAPQNSSITRGVITGQTLLLPQRKVVMNKSSELSYPPRFIVVQLVISPPQCLIGMETPNILQCVQIMLLNKSDSSGVYLLKRSKPQHDNTFYSLYLIG